MPWRTSYFPAERPACPKVRHFYKSHIRRIARAHHAESLGVMISHKNIVSSAMQGVVSGKLNEAVAPVSSSLNPIQPFILMNVMDFRPSPRDPLPFQFR